MRSRAISLVILILAGAVAVGAHHSYADFDQDRSVSVSGTIDKILFANPHVVLMVRRDDSSVYTITWASATQLHRQRVGREDLKVGDAVAVTGSPSRKSAELSKISEVRRMSDGWTWRKGSGRPQ